jgi:hypothetical protein
MTCRGRIAISQATTDPFDRLRRLAIRRGWIPAALPIVAFVAVVIAETLLQPSAVNPFFGNAFSSGTVVALLAAATFTLGYSLLGSVCRLSPLKSRVKEVVWPLRGPTLILDDGLVVSLLGGRFLLLTLLFGLDSSVLRIPVAETLRWTTLRRTRRLATLIPGSIPSPVGAELEALRARLGVRLSFAVVREPRQQLPSPPNPRWIATLTVSNSFSRSNIERLAAELDAVVDFMKRLVRPYADAALHIALPSGPGKTTPVDIGTARVALPGERPAGASLWRQFRGTAPIFQRMVALTLILTTTTILSGLFAQGLWGLLILIVLIPGGGLIGASARTRRDGFAGGLIFGWAGTFLGILILLPVEAGLQGGGPLTIGVGLLAGFAGGFVLGFIEGLFAGVAGYVSARVAKKPVRAW